MDTDGREQRIGTRAATDGDGVQVDDWTARGMPWRTEPEIDPDRQRFLAQRRTIRPDHEKGIYPFKDITLTRADIEWLLATHESRGARGPVIWEEEREKPDDQRRVGLDLRGADLRGAAPHQGADLSGLPLACLQAGDTQYAPLDPLFENIHAFVPLQKQARRAEARLEGVDFSHADLREANLYKAHLEYATFYGAHLEGANLSLAYLNHALFCGAYLEGTDMRFSVLEAADLVDVHVGPATSLDARKPPRPLDLRGAAFDSHSALDTSTFGRGAHTGYTRCAYANWGSVNFFMVDWRKVHMLGDESIARHPVTYPPTLRRRSVRRIAFEEAVQAHRQLSVTLRDQGQNESADRLAYRAQVLQGVVLRVRRQYLRYIGSVLLDLLAGYGFRPGRAILLYLAVILWFANLYVWASHGLLTFGLPPSQVQPLAWYEAVILSVSSFHGRGFQPFQHLNDPVAALAGVQAVLGLIIEVSFIATFTNRFFTR